LQHLTQDGKVTVYHTATFLDETLRMGDSVREKLKQQWPFLQSICNGGWFKPLLFGQPPKLKSVCDEELDESPKDHNWPSIPSSSHTEIEAKVTRFLEGSGAFPELISTQPVYERIEEVKKDNKALRLKLRTEHNLPKGVTFREYHKANFLDARTVAHSTTS
jgi:hypothetical protein